MPTPISYTDRSPSLDLPFLFPAQAQKEASINEALARIDALVAPAVEGEADVAPASPVQGERWIVGSAPQDVWSGQSEAIAFWVGSTWMFASPSDGMLVFDRMLGAFRHYDGGWNHVVAPTAPTGGAVIDAEARAAIVSLCDSLRAFGLST